MPRHSYSTRIYPGQTIPTFAEAASAALTAKPFFRARDKNRPQKARLAAHFSASLLRQTVTLWQNLASSLQLPPSLLIFIRPYFTRDLFWQDRLARSGARIGCPKLFLALPSGLYHGLFLDFQPPTSFLSHDKLSLHQDLRSKDFLVCVCTSQAQASQVLSDYLAPYSSAANTPSATD